MRVFSQAFSGERVKGDPKFYKTLTGVRFRRVKSCILELNLKSSGHGLAEILVGAPKA